MPTAVVQARNRSRGKYEKADPHSSVKRQTRARSSGEGVQSPERVFSIGLGNVLCNDKALAEQNVIIFVIVDDNMKQSNFGSCRRKRVGSLI
jgi:phage terminase large subunit-like protein